MENSTLSRVRTAAQLLGSQQYNDFRVAVERGALPARIFRRNRLLIERLPVASIPPPDEHVDGLQVRWAEPADLPLLTRIRPRRRQRFERDFANGLSCAIGLISGEPVTMDWIEFKTVHDSPANGYRLRLPEGSAWILGSFVRSDMRGRRLFSDHTRGVARLLRAARATNGYCAVEVDNPASRKAHRQAGYEELVQFEVLRVLGVTVHRIRDLRRPDEPVRMVRGPWDGAITD